VKTDIRRIEIILPV